MTLTKIVDNAGAGTAVASDFELSIEGVIVISGETRFYDANDALKIDEKAKPDYKLKVITGDSKCPDSLGGSLILEPGENLNCVITNLYFPETVNPVRLTLLKNVINDNEGEEIDEAWRLSAIGPVERVGIEGSDAVTFTDVIPGDYILSETGPAGYEPSAWSCIGGSLSGDKLTLVPGDFATCSITNDDKPSAPDIRVEKVTNLERIECPVVIGDLLDFTVIVTNEGLKTVEGVVLGDHWSWQLNPQELPTEYECTQPDDDALECTLGTMDVEDFSQFNLTFEVSGNPGERVCNTATVLGPSAETNISESNEAQVCLDTVDELGLEVIDLPPVIVGLPYDESIKILGGVEPYQSELTGLPSGLERGPENNEFRISGCASTTGLAQIRATANDALSCQSVERDFELRIETDPKCPLSELSVLALRESGVFHANSGLPEESVQKVIVEENPEAENEPNRYFAGYSFVDHSYTSDPNGDFNHIPGNYDIRLTKYNNEGDLIWDKTYDTGNHDIGYAVDISPDGQRLLAGGTSMVGTPSHLWWR